MVAKRDLEVQVAVDAEYAAFLDNAGGGVETLVTYNRMI
jgi:hypothetical protein